MTVVADKIMKISGAMSNDVKGMIQDTGKLAEASGVSMTQLQADIDKLLGPENKVDLSKLVVANGDKPELLIQTIGMALN
jgi:hypothetical protein